MKTPSAPMKLNPFLLFGLGWIVLFHSPGAFAESCVYELDQKSVHVGWTGYKTNQKVGVNGEFKKFDLQGKSPKPASSLSAMIQNFKLSIDPLSVDSGNPARDQTLRDFFFSKAGLSILAQVKSVSDLPQGKTVSGEKGSLVLDLTFNSHQKDVPMDFEVQGTDQLKATGKIDLQDFSAMSAWKSLHEKCFDLHKGTDGESKTWTEVGLNISGKFRKTCK